MFWYHQNYMWVKKFLVGTVIIQFIYNGLNVNFSTIALIYSNLQISFFFNFEVLT